MKTFLRQHKFVALWYGTVRLVRRTDEEKYGTVRYGHLGSTATPYLPLFVAGSQRVAADPR